MTTTIQDFAVWYESNYGESVFELARKGAVEYFTNSYFPSSSDYLNEVDVRIGFRDRGAFETLFEQEPISDVLEEYEEKTGIKPEDIWSQISEQDEVEEYLLNDTEGIVEAVNKERHS